MSRSKTQADATPELSLIDVGVDEFAVVTGDGILMAHLRGSVAICLYDAVLEPGALLHLRALPSSKGHTDLTDVVLSADLLLLEQTFEKVRAAAPRAQYWQAKILAHCPSDDANQAAVASAVAKFAAEWLRESNVTVVELQTLGGQRARVQFRPQMGQLRIATVPA
ncbi:MAG: hypothetical protein NZM12_03905 [Steroidobacteraceae bacterium]|nr:hypothetical protein [Steroidobacteraceae bacterium]MDW8260116.1 hypothetical protein [Gammaproteobacteria bacterium]